MTKLLRAGFWNLLKNRLYYAGLLFSAGISIFAPFSRYMDMRSHPDLYATLGPEYKSVEGFAFALAIMIVFAMSVVVTMFLGTEYSDGTIRNKIIVGHKRFHIYISNYLICAAANVSILLVSYLTVFSVGKLILTESSMTVAEIMQSCACECFTILGFTAILVLISMLNQSKAGASVTALLLTMFLFIFAMALSNSLLQPEYNERQVILALEDDEGNLYHKVEIQAEANPKYPVGTKRIVYEQLDRLLPLNQLARVSDGRDYGTRGIMALYSALTVLVLGGVGIVLFQKKDLK